MELNRYKLLKIPIVSKRRSLEIANLSIGNNKYSFEGECYYIVDTSTWCIVWERLKINKTNYRTTDQKMKITSFYNQKLKQGINREDIFPKSKNKIEIANQNQINLVNEISFNKFKTILSTEGFISGSNSSGAEKKISASPILIDPRYNKDYVRFINAIKRIRLHNKIVNNFIIENFSSFEDIDYSFKNQIVLNDLIKNNEMFSKWLKIINSNLIRSDNKSIIEYINDVSKGEIKYSVDYLIALYQEGFLKKENVINKLRREFRVSLLKEAKEYHINEYLGENDIDLFDTEAAHLLGVKEIKENNLNLKWISNPNNGVLLSPTAHTILDKYKITFDLEGNVISFDDKYKNWTNKSIKNKLMNNERKMFIKFRNEYRK